MDESSLLLLVSLVLLVGLSAIFSGLEVALLSVPQVRVNAFVKNKKRGAEALKRIKAKSSQMIITILVGNNIVNTAVAALATAIALESFGSKGLGLATGVITLVILVFGEITPKTLASNHSDRIALLVARPLEILMKILWPIVFFLEKIPNLLGRRMKKNATKPISKLEIRAMIEYGAENKVLESEEKQIMLRTTRLKNTDAEDIMTPIEQIFSLDAERSLVDTIEEISSHGYSRVPIFEKEKSKVIGILYVKEILTKLSDEKSAKEPVKNFIKKPIFLDKNSEVKDIFKLFLNKHIHIAIVTDGKKNIGLVTLEDLLEEIVGEIVDEHDITPHNLIPTGRRAVLAHSETTLSHINKTLDVSIPISRSRETIGEFFNAQKKKDQYHKGDTITLKACKIFVVEVEDGRVLHFKVLARRQPHRRR